MDSDVVQASVIEPGSFRVRFADGLEGTVRFAPTAYRGVFAPLRDPTAFNQLTVNGYFVTWPGELDLCPETMHRHIKANGVWVVE